jgi:periplasmic copper chaperone A
MRNWLMLLGLTLILPSTAHADAKASPANVVEATGAWARATVPGQSGTGAFMTLTARDDVRVVGAASAVAGVVELHEMTMTGNVMKMRAIAGLDLPAGRAVRLAPSGHHVMLMDLKRALAAGEKVTIELRLETKDGRLITQPVEVEVRARAPDPRRH